MIGGEGRTLYFGQLEGGGAPIRDETAANEAAGLPGRLMRRPPMTLTYCNHRGPVCGHKGDTALCDHSHIDTKPSAQCRSAAKLVTPPEYSSGGSGGHLESQLNMQWRMVVLQKAAPAIMSPRESELRSGCPTPSEPIVDCAKIDNGRIDDQSLVW